MQAAADIFKGDYITGGLEIIIGVFLTFWGAMAINLAVGTILFVGFAVAFFVGIKEVGVVEGLDEDKKRAMFIVGLSCMILSMVVNHFVHRFVKRETIVGILGAILLAAAGSLLLGMTIKGKVPEWGFVTLVVLIGVLGFFLIRKFERYIMAWSTAIIGVIFVAHGVGEYLDGTFPFFQDKGGVKNFGDLDDVKFDTPLIVYLVSMIVGAIIGALF